MWLRLKPEATFCSRVAFGQQVAGQLLDRELVERQIAVERADDPVAPRPHPAMAVDVVAVRVGVARGVEPGHGHALAVVRRLQQRVDALFVRVGRAVGEKGVDLGGRRRQARQVVGHAAQQRRLVGLGRRLQPFALQAREDEPIDRVPDPVVLARPAGSSGRDRRACRPSACPTSRLRRSSGAAARSAARSARAPNRAAASASRDRDW